MLTVKFQLENETYELPGKYEICSKCEGQGFILNPSIGQHAYSMEEFSEEYPNEESREHYFTRGGMYDIGCPDCVNGKVIIVDVIRADPKVFELYQNHLDTLERARHEEVYCRQHGY